MSGFVEFASRYHKLRLDLQEIEEIQYARLLQQEHALMAALRELDAQERQSRAEQATRLDVGAWHSHHAFQQRLAAKRSKLAQQWAELADHLKTQQGKLQDAYIEQEKWSHIAENAMTEVVAKRFRRAQIAADDEALRRFGRVDA